MDPFTVVGVVLALSTIAAKVSEHVGQKSREAKLVGYRQLTFPGGLVFSPEEWAILGNARHAPVGQAVRNASARGRWVKEGK